MNWMEATEKAFNGETIKLEIKKGVVISFSDLTKRNDWYVEATLKKPSERIINFPKGTVIDEGFLNGLILINKDELGRVLDEMAEDIHDLKENSVRNVVVNDVYRSTFT
jgi:hypothetical protein